MPGWLPAAITAAGMIGSKILGGSQQKRNIEKTNRAKMELAEYQFSKNREMWKEMQEYNRPEAQMKRFEEAGLSKHLIYGQGTPGNVQSHPEFQAPNISFRGTPSVAAQGLQGAAESLSHYTGARQDLLEVEQAKLQNIGMSFSNQVAEVKALDAERRNHLASLLHGAIRKTPERRIKKYLVDNWVAEMNSKEQQVIAQKLENSFKKIRNEFAEKGITLGDSVYLRLGEKILDALGVKTESFLNKLGQ